jgi:DNA polymerase-1
MVDISLRLKKEKPGAQMLLQVHDELLFEVPSEKRWPVEELVRREMEYVWVLDVPLRVEIGWGANWTEAHA